MEDEGFFNNHLFSSMEDERSFFVLLSSAMDGEYIFSVSLSSEPSEGRFFYGLSLTPVK